MLGCLCCRRQWGKSHQFSEIFWWTSLFLLLFFFNQYFLIMHDFIVSLEQATHSFINSIFYIRKQIHWSHHLLNLNYLSPVLKIHHACILHMFSVYQNNTVNVTGGILISWIDISLGSRSTLITSYFVALCCLLLVATSLAVMFLAHYSGIGCLHGTESSPLCSTAL